MKATWLALALVALSAFTGRTQEGESKPQTVRFLSVDVFIDAKDAPLAAYQLEFTASPGVKIVGIEGRDQ